MREEDILLAHWNQMDNEQKFIYQFSYIRFINEAKEDVLNFYNRKNGRGETMINLPDQEDATNRIERGEEYSPLDWFVYHHEPAGVSEGANFRAQLQAVLECVCKQERKTCPPLY